MSEARRARDAAADSWSNAPAGSEVIPFLA